MTARSSGFAVLVAVSASVGVGRAQDVVAPVVVGPPDAAGPVAGAPVVFAPTFQPFMTFEAGATFLKRSSPRRHGTIGELLNLDTDEVHRSIGTNQLDYPFEAGPNLTLRFHGRDGGSFDLRWLGLDNWADTLVLETEEADPIGTRTPVSPFAFVLEDGAELGGINARFASYFHSFQAGRTWVVRETEDYVYTNYVGFRYIYFRDAIEVERDGTVDNEAYGWASNNNLLGLEAGLDLGQHYGFITLGAKGRIGGYANYGHLKGDYQITIGSTQGYAPVDLTTPSDGFTGFSGVFDLGLYSTIRYNRNFALKFGYDFILMTNLVLATENMQDSLITITPVPGAFPAITPGELRAHGNSVVFLHGLSVSAEATW